MAVVQGYALRLTPKWRPKLVPVHENLHVSLQGPLVKARVQE